MLRTKQVQIRHLLQSQAMHHGAMGLRVADKHVRVHVCVHAHVRACVRAVWRVHARLSVGWVVAKPPRTPVPGGSPPPGASQ